MSEKGLKFGVCLYSLADTFQSGKADLEGIIKKSKDMGYTGITLVAAQHCDMYPYPTDEWLYNFAAMLKKYEIEPLCWESYIDMGMRNDRDMNEAEIEDCVRNDMVYASKAGFPIVKTQHSITPAIFEKMLPLCKKLNVKLAIELHHPHHPLVPVWQEYFKIMEKSEGWLGVIIDAGIFQKYPSELHIREAYEFGCRKEVMEKVLELKRNGNPKSDMEAIEMTDTEKEFAEVFFEKFNSEAKTPQLYDMLKYCPLFHGKYYYIGEDLNDPCIPYDEIVKILKDTGFNGYIVAEYEGHHMTSEEDEAVQLDRYFKMLNRLYEEA